ncbi:MAG: YceI family protein [bacterium]|nr:YceI family protein [bacterium]
MKTQLLRIALVVVAVSGISVSASATDEYTIDQTHSSISFTVRHMVVSKVRGSFTEVSGAILYDADDPTKSSVNATIPAASINTANEGRDKHLRGEDFFDADKFPQLSFVSTAVRKNDQGLALVGDLTMHGVTRSIEIPFQVNGPIIDGRGNLRMGIEAEPVVIDRKDYGIEWNRVLDGGGLSVGNEVTVEINLEAIHKMKTGNE